MPKPQSVRYTMVLFELADSSVEHSPVSVLCQGLYLYLGLL